jgi:hypothetical protein
MDGAESMMCVGPEKEPTSRQDTARQQQSSADQSSITVDLNVTSDYDGYVMCLELKNPKILIAGDFNFAAV